MSKTTKTPILLIGAIVGAIAVAGGWFMTRGGGAPEAAIAQTTMDNTGEASAGAVDGEGRPDLFIGNADAPVELIEYASFTCPHCANFHKNVYPKIKAEFIETDKVKFVFREVYFDKYGLAAGLLARCGGDLRYFGIVDLLMDKQSEWMQGEGDAIIQNLYRIGRQAGLENDQMQACLSDKELSKELVADFQLKAGRDGINATPSFVVNGENMSNMPWEEFKAALEAKLN